MRENTTLSSNTNTVLPSFTTRYRNTCPAAAAWEMSAAPGKAAKLNTTHAAILRPTTTAGKHWAHSNGPQTRALMTRLITFPAMILLQTLRQLFGLFCVYWIPAFITATGTAVKSYTAAVMLLSKVTSCLSMLSRGAQNYSGLTKHKWQCSTLRLYLLTILGFGLLCQHCRNQTFQF